MREWFSKVDDDALPERVREAIHQQEDATERLISWIQLTVVVVFGVLYLFSPKPEVEFALTPWALAVYLMLTIVRVIWSHIARLPGWALLISVFFDMALLIALIWSFHIQYGQPASFYLKAPTMLYIFIFIALRALRFELIYVLFAGMVASLGWGFLILYVLYADPADNMITRDYVAYLTSNTILLGAEFDKIISIMMVTFIIAVALYRAKLLLVRAVAEQTAARDLSRFFSPEIAEKIKSSDKQITAGSGEIRQATVLNLDMRGFTRLAGSASPAEAMAVLGEYQRRMVPIIVKHGGSIDKFLGDGILATFGAAEPNGTYAADALRALEETIAEAVRWQAECEKSGRSCPPVNGAAASGPILFGAVGDESRLEYTVIGDAVNLSAKIEKQNKELGVRAVCDRTTYDLALAQGYEPQGQKRQLPAVTVGGVANPLDLVVIAA